MSDCLFCKIIKKEIPAKIEFEDSDTFVMHDINPQAPSHVLILPKKHIASISEMTAEDTVLLGKVIFSAKKLADKNGWKDYRLVFNNGPEAGQSVYHIHLHLLTGRKMIWPPG